MSGKVRACDLNRTSFRGMCMSGRGGRGKGSAWIGIVWGVFSFFCSFNLGVLKIGEMAPERAQTCRQISLSISAADNSGHLSGPSPTVA